MAVPSLWNTTVVTTTFPSKSAQNEHGSGRHAGSWSARVLPVRPGGPTPFPSGFVPRPSHASDPSPPGPCPGALTSHVDGEATASTSDCIMSPWQWQDRAAIRTEIQVRLEAGAVAGEVHDRRVGEGCEGKRLLTKDSTPPHSGAIPIMGLS